MESSFNIMEELTTNGNGKSHKESLRTIHRSYAYGDVPDIFRRMYEVADFLAAKEGLTWIQTKYKQEILDAQSQEQKDGNNGHNSKVPELPTDLEEKLFDFVTAKREEHIKLMTRLLEIRSSSGVIPIPRYS